MTNSTGQSISKVLGVYQIAAGSAGLILSLYHSYSTFRINIFFFFYSFIILALCCFCIYAGTKCFKGTTWGLDLTLYSQLLQFIAFTFFGFQYLFNPGLGLFLGVDITSGTDFIYKFRFTSFGIGKADPEQQTLVLNLIPIAISLLVDPVKQSIHTANNVLPKAGLTE